MTNRSRIRDPRPLPPIQGFEHRLPYPSFGEIILIYVAFGAALAFSAIAIVRYVFGG